VVTDTKWRYRLWRYRRGWFSGEWIDVTGITGGWFDLADRASVIKEFAKAISSSGRSIDTVGEYRLEVLDPSSSESVEFITTSPQEAEAVLGAPAQPASGVPQPTAALENASDEWLVQQMSAIARELGRRLRMRR
jgi:hypothetical protein